MANNDPNFFPLDFDHTKLVVGALFYEKGYGMLMKFKVVEPPKFERGAEDRKVCSWTATRLVQDGEEEEVTQFMTTEGLTHYGPKIYLEDEVVNINGRIFTTR